jgi:YnbE-like lipoprotein
MKAPMLTRLRASATQGAMTWPKFLLAAPLILASAGCVQVAAPEKPIEINLNINIRQEVVVRLQQDVRDLIKENPGVF